MIKYLKRNLYVKRVNLKIIKKMSTNKKGDKIPLSGSAKKHVFDNGGSVLNISVKVSQLVEILEAVNTKRNQLGHASTDYLNLVIKERREVGDFGDTHYIQFEPWFPEPKNAPQEEKKAKNDGLPF